MTRSDELLPRWITGAVIGLAFVTLTALEIYRSLRREREPKLTRLARNLTIAGIGAVAVNLAELPVIIPLARHIAGEHSFIRSIVAILLMDYTLYLWHVLTHKVPFLWRFHLAHHIDHDCDASTALRFHFGELLLSVPFRAAQIVVFGVSVREYSIWQTMTFASILFHHSNVDLSPEWDRRLSWLVVTPRMHGIHHDARLDHTNSNWSSGLSIWDRLHGTLQLGVPQSEVDIGVPAYRDPEDVTLGRTLVVPFEKQRDDWHPEPRARTSRI